MCSLQLPSWHLNTASNDKVGAKYVDFIDQVRTFGVRIGELGSGAGHY